MDLADFFLYMSLWTMHDYAGRYKLKDAFNSFLILYSRWLRCESSGTA